MSDVLCLYYSRSGQTKSAMWEIAGALNGELAEITDGMDRSGFKGYMRAGMEAMNPTTQPLQPIKASRPLQEYRLVIVGTPVWAGRCAAPIRGFLKQCGAELERVAYVLTRDSDRRYEEIYQQMDKYTAKEHLLAVSLRPDDVGYEFWRDMFVQDVRRYLEG
ncbi:MAG: hypothetical protein KBS74_08185 [Clostridiales bacterium]|nr:hypothetical protein [Candidatus Cacconaster stercorequi]